jgi:hypothetical protein
VGDTVSFKCESDYEKRSPPTITWKKYIQFDGVDVSRGLHGHIVHEHVVQQCEFDGKCCVIVDGTCGNVSKTVNLDIDAEVSFTLADSLNVYRAEFNYLM